MKTRKLWPLLEAGLGPAQVKVCYGLLGGLTNPEIAVELGVKVRTIKSILCKLFLRAGLDAQLHQRIALSIWLYRHSDPVEDSTLA